MSKHILIIDDDQDFTEAIAVRCRTLAPDVEVAVAHTPLSAVQAVGAQKPDLICLDVNMPTGDGLSICEFLDKNPTTKEVPVIILTGRTDEKTVRRCNDLRAYYVHKSADLWQRLRAVITELVDFERPAKAAS